MGQDEKDLGPDGEQEPEPEALPDEGAATEAEVAAPESPFDEAAPPPQAQRPVSVRPAAPRPSSDFDDDGKPEAGTKSPRRYSRRG